MSTNRPAAQSDIAARLGIGQKTVSRVFGGGPVSPTTRARVLQAARDLGYRPNAGARAMRTGRTGGVALLQSTRESASAMPGDMLAGLSETLGEADTNLLIARFDDERLIDPSHLPKALRELTVDGVLVNYDTDAPEPLPGLLEQAGLPAVWINSDRQHDAVRPDDRAAGAGLARHLLAAGHRHLVWTDIHARWTGMLHYSRQHRRDGFLQTVQAAGAVAEDWSPTHALPDPAAWYRGLLSARPDPLAIGCYGENEFTALLRAACLLGRRVPEDVSLAGVMCGPLIGTQVDSARFDLRELGRVVARMLLERIHGGPRQSTRLITPTIIQGGSVAPPINS